MRNYRPAMTTQIIAAAPLQNGYLIIVDTDFSWQAFKDGQEMPCRTKSECNRFPKFVAKIAQELVAACKAA